MKCINHLDKDATAVCNHCGKSICQDCQVQMHGEVYCQGCATQSLGQQKAKPEHSPALAAILSFIIAGLGQIYNGQMGKGILIFLTGWLIIPWIIGIFDAYSCAKKIKEGAITVKSRPGCIIGFVVGVVVFYMGIFMIALLAAIAIPNLLRARISANEAAAEATLKTMATAIETYRVDKGAYPETEYSLNSYLSQAYQNKTVYGYTFTEDLRPDGYTITATPETCQVTGTKVFTMETDGVISTKECAVQE